MSKVWPSDHREDRRSCIWPSYCLVQNFPETRPFANHLWDDRTLILVPYNCKIRRNFFSPLTWFCFNMGGAQTAPSNIKFYILIYSHWLCTVLRYILEYIYNARIAKGRTSLCLLSTCKHDQTFYLIWYLYVESTHRIYLPMCYSNTKQYIYEKKKTLYFINNFIKLYQYMHWYPKCIWKIHV